MRHSQLKEEAALFGPGRSLVGIVADPPPALRRHSHPAVIVLNSGIVHRVGPGRIYVRIARELAERGFVTMRFDFSGIGDSMARQDALPFKKSAICETQNAMEYLRRTRGIDRFICLGGCSGAQVSLDAAGCDPRIIGGILINFQAAEAGDAESQDAESQPDIITRRAASYYWDRALGDRKSWYRFLTGQSDYRKLIRALQYRLRRRLAPPARTRETSPLEADLQRLAQRNVQMAFLCSEGDPLLDDLRDAGGAVLEQLHTSGKIALEIIPRSDHTFSSRDDQRRLLAVVVERVGTISTVQMPTSRDELLLSYRGAIPGGAASMGRFVKEVSDEY
jgi:hypothetical protein